MGDLNMLLRYICQYVPMGAGGGMHPPQGVGRPLTDTASTSDGVRVWETLHHDDCHLHAGHQSMFGTSTPQAWALPGLHAKASCFWPAARRAQLCAGLAEHLSNAPH